MRDTRLAWTAWIAIALMAACSPAAGTSPPAGSVTADGRLVTPSAMGSAPDMTPVEPGLTPTTRRERMWQLPPGVSIFRKALVASGVIEELRDAGTLTVFAPMDEAFKKLPEGEWQAILDNPPRLRDVVLFHIVAGAWTTGALPDVSSLTSLQGSPLAIREEEGKRFTVNGVYLLFPDTQIARLVLHRIDTVLMPPMP